ncbi:MAG: hypothetical protein ACYSUF_02760 [Planctomycetota bacterium]|jgi:uncharacterized lipoprotein
MKTLSRIVLAASVVVVVGCSKQEKVDFKSITAKPAPEMASTADRSVDMDGNYAYMRNTNYRSFWDDLQRTLYLDNPSRLSPYPIVQLSGNPR